jgi:RNA methyltransferase, TrmH family
MSIRITSTANPQIKSIIDLQKKAKERNQQNLIVIEGWREIRLAIEAGFRLKTLYRCPELIRSNSFETGIQALVPEDLCTDIAPHVFEKLAYRDSSDGLIALAEPKFYDLSSFKVKKDPLVIVLESVEKPGNLGAVLRTADAAGVDGVIICDPRADIYNPNTIRSSIGCVFTVPVVLCNSARTIEWLKGKGIQILSAALTAKKSYHEIDMKGPLAVVMGTEATGLTDQWLDAADESILIPMSGKIDSLNVSVSTAIIVFEAKRQRGF